MWEGPRGRAGGWIREAALACFFPGDLNLLCGWSGTECRHKEVAVSVLPPMSVSPPVLVETFPLTCLVSVAACHSASFPFRPLLTHDCCQGPCNRRARQESLALPTTARGKGGTMLRHLFVLSLLLQGRAADFQPFLFNSRAGSIAAQHKCPGP